MNDVPRQRLRDLIATYGRSLCDDPRRCEALLRDFCGEHRREINVLVNALRERVAADLLSSSANVPQEVLLGRLVKRLQDDLALSEEAARWAVESWAIALGLFKVSEAPKPPVTPPPVPTPSKKGPGVRVGLIAAGIAAVIIVLLLAFGISKDRAKKASSEKPVETSSIPFFTPPEKPVASDKLRPSVKEETQHGTTPSLQSVPKPASTSAPDVQTQTGPPISSTEIATLYDRGAAYVAKNQLDEAILEFSELLKVDSRNHRAYSARGLAFVAKHMYFEAIADCSRAIAFDPKDANAYYGRGLAFESLEQHWDAIDDYERFIRYASPEDSVQIEDAKRRIQSIKWRRR